MQTSPGMRSLFQSATMMTDRAHHDGIGIASPSDADVLAGRGNACK